MAHPIGFARIVTHQRTRGFVVAEIFAAKVLGEDQPVATQIIDRGEKSERLDAGDPALDKLADLVGEKGGNIAVDCVALGFHGPPFEHRNLLANLLEAFFVAGRQPALA